MHLISEQSEEQFARLQSGVRLCYRTYGSRAGEPLLLIAGLGLDLTWWPETMLSALVARGFYVVTYDNRDTGRSSAIGNEPPSPLRLVLRWPRKDGYDLGDMAGDAAGLLQHLAIARAHVVGMSMGGMIGQTLAAREPAPVATLTSMFSTTGASNVGQPALSTLLRMAQLPPRTREQMLARHLRVWNHIVSGPYDAELEESRLYGIRSWERGFAGAADSGVARQLNAIFLSGDRTSELRRIQAPTLVMHGDVDKMIHPSGGRATAKAIAGARFEEIQGMRHYIPRPVIPQVVALIAEHAQGEARHVARSSMAS